MQPKQLKKAKFSIGEVVRHRLFEFRGVIYDVDFQFNNSDEWYQSIPKDARPRKDQPFYHLLAENDEITYEAYVSEQNLVLDDRSDPIGHPLLNEIFKNWNGLNLKPNEKDNKSNSAKNYILNGTCFINDIKNTKKKIDLTKYNF